MKGVVVAVLIFIILAISLGYWLFEVNSPDSCEDINLITERDDYYRMQAIFRADVSICEEISSDSQEKDFCYDSLASKLDNLSLCDKVNVTSFGRDYCILNFVMKHGDISLCKKIMGGVSRVRCYDSSPELQDISICDMDNINERTECIIQIAGAKKDLSICDEYIAEDLFLAGLSIRKINALDKCYAMVSISTKNISICAKIRDELERNDCNYLAS